MGVALLLGGVALVNLLADSLEQGVIATSEARARQVAAGLESSGDVGSLATDDEEELIQVVDADGDVIASSRNVDGLGAVASLEAGDSTEVEVPRLDNGAFVVVAEGDGDTTVLVGSSLEEVTESTQALVRLLTVGLPLLLVVVAATTWAVVGRALAPVAAIRAEVDEISASVLHRRVPVPPRDDEISRLATTMNRMLGRVEAAHTRQRQFVSDASHELRSPVASTRQHAEVALAHPGRTSVEALARTVLAENSRVQLLVENLLLLARADEGAWPAATEAVDLDDLVLEEARRVRAGAVVQVDTFAVSAGRVRGVRGLLRSLVANLLDNAARHARGTVQVTLREDVKTGHVVLRVDDDGPGIPPSDRSRVFDRFVRLDEARGRDHGGSGLGLAIVAEVARVHGATVDVAESPAGGARLEVRLPLSDA